MVPLPCYTIQAGADGWFTSHTNLPTIPYNELCTIKFSLSLYLSFLSFPHTLFLSHAHSLTVAYSLSQLLSSEHLKKCIYKLLLYFIMQVKLIIPWKIVSKKLSILLCHFFSGTYTGWPRSYRKYILQITQPSQSGYAKSQYRYAVVSWSPSIIEYIVIRWTSCFNLIS